MTKEMSKNDKISCLLISVFVVLAMALCGVWGIRQAFTNSVLGERPGFDITLIKVARTPHRTITPVPTRPRVTLTPKDLSNLNPSLKHTPTLLSPCACIRFQGF